MKQVDLGKDSLRKLAIRLVIPSILAQIVCSMYSIVDRMFIGHSEGGEFALAGIGVCGSILSIVTAINAFVGNGGAPIFSMALGKNDTKRAEKIMGNSCTLLLISSIILMLIYLIWGKTFLLQFGASKNTIEYAYDYLSVYILGNIFCQITYGLNPYISAQGCSGVAMGTSILGAVVNLVLDPLFIYVFQWGVKGAALASVIGQLCSAIWVIRFLTKGSIVRLNLSSLKINYKIVTALAALGVTPFIMHFTESVVSVTINSSLKHWGSDLHISTMSVAGAIFQMFLMPVWGITGGLQAVISYNYGAQNYKRVKSAFKMMVLLAMPITIIASLGIIIFPEFFANMFSDNTALVSIASRILPIYFSGVWAFGIQTTCQTLLMSLGEAKISMFLALLRKVILLLPLVIVLPYFFDIEGIFLAQPIADIGAAIITGLLALKVIKKKLST